MKIKGIIVRMNPYEISMNDPGYIDQVFAKTRDRSRVDRHKGILNVMQNGLTVTGVIRESFAATISHDLHWKRRAAVKTYFLKATVRWLEHVFQTVLANLLRRLEACHKSSEIMSISRAHRAVSSQHITLANLLRIWAERIVIDLIRTRGIRSLMSAWFIHLPWLMSALPNSFLCTLMPGFCDWL